MKTAIKTLGIAAGLILLALILIPVIFKGRIKEKVEYEINRSLNAEVNFGSVRISMFRHWPDLTVNVRNLVVKGKDVFASDTLAQVENLSLTVNLKSVLKGKVYEVKQIRLLHPRLLFKVLKDGSVNWDILKETSNNNEASSSQAFRAMLDKIAVSGGRLIYDDAEIPMYLDFDGINGYCSGDMTNDITTLDVNAACSSIDAGYDNVRYLAKANAEVSTRLKADLGTWTFTFDKGSARVNELHFDAGGMFAMPDEGYRMDIAFTAKENSFKSFLSFIPAIYSNDFDKLRSGGYMAFQGRVNGLYSDDSVPAFDISLKIRDGWFSYPSLPGKVSEVSLQAAIFNPDGIIDHTVVDVDKLHLRLIQNPIDATLQLHNPVSDPEIVASVKGKLNLADISKIYPLENSVKLAGLIAADIKAAGRISDLENGDYDRFAASGFAELHQVVAAAKDLPQTLQVEKARFDFTPALIRLSGLNAIIGKNDIAANGQLMNYLPYLLKKNAVLAGQLTTTSRLLDLNSLLASKNDTVQSSDGVNIAAIDIPANINLSLNSTFDRLQYEKYDLTNVNCVLEVKDKKLSFSNMQANALGGNIVLNGSYSSANPEKPLVDLNAEMKNIDLRQSYRSFVTMQKLAPIAEKISGSFSTRLKFSSSLRQNMMPEFSSISAYGLLLSDALGMQGTNTMLKISEALQLEKLRNPAIEKINLSFDLIGGKAKVNKTTLKLAGFLADVSGIIGLDQSINFTLNLQVPRSEFGNKANSALDGMIADASKKGIQVKIGEMVPITVLITGTVTDPKVTTGIKSAMAMAAADLEKQALEQVEMKKAEMLQQAKNEAAALILKADEQAVRLIAEAELQGKKVVATAAEAAAKLRFVTDSTANYMVSEGRKNGMAAEIVAKKAAEKTRKEGYARADKLVSDAQAKSDEIIATARAEAEKLKNGTLEKIK